MIKVGFPLSKLAVAPLQLLAQIRQRLSLLSTSGQGLLKHLLQLGETLADLIRLLPGGTLLIFCSTELLGRGIMSSSECILHESEIVFD